MASRVRRWSAHGRPWTGPAGINGSIRSYIESVITHRMDISSNPATRQPANETRSSGRSATWDDLSVTRLVDRGRSLEELERERWPTPSAGATRLITTAHALRRRPIGELTVEDMRLLIGQDVGLAFLLPLALEVLGDDPMAEGAMYEGDLLSAVLTISPAVWKEWPELGRELAVIVSELTDLTPPLSQVTARFLAR